MRARFPGPLRGQMNRMRSCLFQAFLIVGQCADGFADFQSGAWAGDIDVVHALGVPVGTGCRHLRADEYGCSTSQGFLDDQGEPLSMAGEHQEISVLVVGDDCCRRQPFDNIYVFWKVRPMTRGVRALADERPENAGQVEAIAKMLHALLCHETPHEKQFEPGAWRPRMRRVVDVMVDTVVHQHGWMAIAREAAEVDHHLIGNEDNLVRRAQHPAGDRPVEQSQDSLQRARAQGEVADVLRQHDGFPPQLRKQHRGEARKVKRIVQVHDIGLGYLLPQAGECGDAPDRARQSKPAFQWIPVTRGRELQAILVLGQRLVCIQAGYPDNVRAAGGDVTGQLIGHDLNSAAMARIKSTDLKDIHRHGCFGAAANESFSSFDHDPASVVNSMQIGLFVSFLEVLIYGFPRPFPMSIIIHDQKAARR